MVQPDSLVDAARRFLDDLMPILKKGGPGELDRPLPLPGWPRWILTHDLGRSTRRYAAIPRFLTAEHQCAVRILGELRTSGMQSLADLDRTLAADPIVGPRLNHPVSSSGAGGQTWQGPSLIVWLVDHAITQAGGFDFPASTRDSLTTKWAEVLRRPSDLITVVVVLREFAAPSVPIVLKPGLVIDELNEEEIAAALMSGAGQGGLSLNERIVSTVFGIRSSCESRLFVDGVPPTEDQPEMDVRVDARQRAERVLLALRVFKAGRVGTSGSFEYTRSFDTPVSPVSWALGPFFGWHSGEPYVLTSEELPRFREFWSAFEEVHARPVISGALRRFSFAANRSLPDDEIVDLMIAAESLFLSETDEKFRGELRFRLATRAAFLLGTTPTERVQFFKFLGRAYDARSVIVHGGVLSHEGLRRLNGESGSVHEFADDLECVLRDALQRAIGLIMSDEPFPPDWVKLMFR
jgi:Apea-like HEPN